MDLAVQEHLRQINRQFYEQFARAFADSRSAGQASLRRVLATIGEKASVLDVGCGDGRVARALDAMGRAALYVGVDANGAFIELARQKAISLARLAPVFLTVDAMQPGWETSLPRRSFDVVLTLAVLHHIPGDGNRQRFVGQLAALLAPGGSLVISTWQFLSSERLRRKIVPWEALGLSSAQVDAGDYVIDWQRGGRGLRYCHLLDENAVRILCKGAGLTIREAYLADGGLNLYVVAG